MDLPGSGRRTSYSLLSQFRDDAAVLQRQSSGSSYGAGSSLSASSDYPFHLPPASAAGAGDGSAAGAGGSPCKSWAQQAEETYQLQLALALRLCADAACAADPGFLDPGDSGSGSGSGRAFPLAPPTPSAETLSHRFWVNGSLSYNNTIPDGFYLIHGMDPFVWSLCTDVHEENRIPSMESLKSVRPDDSSIQVILIDRRTDFDLGMLESYASRFLASSADMKDVVNQLAKLVSSRMGGTTSNEENLLSRWKKCSEDIKSSTGSIVLHLGKLPIGLCKHRSLLFKDTASPHARRGMTGARVMHRLYQTWCQPVATDFDSVSSPLGLVSLTLYMYPSTLTFTAGSLMYMMATHVQVALLMSIVC